MLTVLFDHIEALGLVRSVVTVPWLYPALSALHIVGIGTLFGSIAAMDLRLLRFLGPQFDPALPILVKMAVFGFALAVTTGLLLASVRISDYAQNNAFLTKMTILAVAGFNAWLLRRLRPGADLAALVGTLRGRLSATASLFLWLGAVFAGRWIAFS